MKTLLTMIGLLFSAVITAQTNYYTATKIFYEDGYTYQCDVPSYKLVTLYNKSNRYTYIDQVYTDIGEPFVMPASGIDLTEDDTWTRAKRYAIVKNAFTIAEQERVKGHELTITLVINSNTGKIDEVYFRIANFTPYATIPVSIFRKIEVELKKNVWFTPTIEGRKLNYIGLRWFQDPSDAI